MPLRRCTIALILSLFLALLACARAGNIPAPAPTPNPSPDPPAGPALDQYGGRTDVRAPALHPHRVPVTCTQSNGSGAAGTILLCQIANYSTGQIFYQPTGMAGYPSNTGAMTNWQVVISSPSLTFNIATNEPFIVDSTGTMDTPFLTTSSTQGAAHLTSFNPATGVMTLTLGNSALVTAPTAGFIRPGRWSVQNVATPFGTGAQFVDPAGNWMWLETDTQSCVTGCSPSYTASVKAKYGSTTADLCNAAKYENLDLEYAGFNALGENSDQTMQENVNGSCSGANFFNSLPSLGGLTLYTGFAHGSMDDLQAFAPQPAHDLNHVLDQVLADGIIHDNVDYADPNFSAYVFNAMGATSFNALNGAYSGKQFCYESTMCDVLGADDVDYMTDGNNDQFWNPAPGQIAGIGVNQGYVVAIAPLHASFEPKDGVNTRTPFIFPTDTDYLKVLSATAPAGCYYPTTAIPGSSTSGQTSYGGLMGPSYNGCSWPDFVRNWFNGSLSSMNTAFGSSYDTFGTDETVVADGVPVGCTNSCIGNGTITVFTFTLNGTVTPGSIHINITPPTATGLPEMMIAGDCPEMNPGCSITGEPATFGELRQMNLNSTTGNCGWQNSTWYPITSAGWAITDCLGYTEVETAGGESGSGSSSPFTVNKGVGGTTTDNGVTWTNYDSAIEGGVNSACNYETGSCEITFQNALASGTKITVSYTYDGWACQTVGGCASSGGRGFEDEDGSSANVAGGKTVTGNNSAAIVHVPSWAASTAYPFAAVIEDTTTSTYQHQETSGGCTSGSGSAPTFSATRGTTVADNTCLWVSDGTWPAGPGSGGEVPAPNDNAVWGLVAHTWIAGRLWFYDTITQAAWHDFFPDQLMLNPNDYSTTPPAGSLQAAYQTGMPAVYGSGLLMDTSLDANAFWKWKEFQTFYPGAVLVETYYDSTQSWTGGCDAVGNPYCPSTVAQKGQYWYNHIKGALGHGNQSGTFNYAGVDCFSCQQDIQKHGYGMVKDVADNLMNGIEDVTTTGIACQNGVGTKCGNDPNGSVTPSSSDCITGGCFQNWTTPYGYNDLTGPTGVIAANQLWLTGPPALPTAPTKSIIFALRSSRRRSHSSVPSPAKITTFK